MDIWVYMDIYGYIRLYVDIYYYIYIYTYMCVFLEGLLVFLHLQRWCSTLPPDVRAFSSDTPHCWHFFANQSYENVPMDRVIISRFRWKVGFDLFFTTQNQLFDENTDFRFHCLFAKIHHTWERLLFFWDSHLGKAFIFWRFPFWEFECI